MKLARFITFYPVLSITALLSCAVPEPVAESVETIRVGSLYNPNDAKIAIFVSQQHYGNGQFKVINEQGEVVYNNKLQDTTKAASWDYAANADFSALTTPGEYMVQVGNNTKSVPLRIAENAHQELIPMLLGIFLANRDGHEPSPYHKPSHLNDAIVESGAYDKKHIDLTGGWMDAGDQIHFTATTAYSALILQLAAQLDDNHGRLLQEEADVGIRWLLKAHPFPDLFIGQVGGVEDHDIGFRDPALDDSSNDPRLSHRKAYPTRLASVMGKAAAALALAAGRSSGDMQSQLLKHATEWYQAAKANPKTEPLLPGNYYNDETWQDDLSLAATMLWRVTQDGQYLKDAWSYLDKNDDDWASHSSVRNLVVADLCGAFGHQPVADKNIHQQACAMVKRFADYAIQLSYHGNAPWGTPGELYWGHTTLNGLRGAHVALAKKLGLVDNAQVATRARDWLLGLNPWGASFIVGYGKNSPTTPHHWTGVLKTKPEGAVVDGPVNKAAIKDSNPPETELEAFSSDWAVFSKDRKNYATNEPAIDFNAHTILLMVALNALAAQ